MGFPFREALEDESLRELFQRLVADGKTLATAELAVYKRQALARFAAMRMGLILFVVALLLVFGAVTTLLVGLALGLARWVGPAGGGAIVALGALVVAGLLGWIGAKSLSGGEA